MKKIAFFSVCIIVAIAVLYSDNNNTIYDNWYRKDVGEVNLFGKEIHTIKLKTSDGSDEQYFVLYDENRHGMYCSKIEKKKNLYICTPMEIKNKKLYDDNKLQDVIKESNSNKGFFAHIEMNNYIFSKILNIDISDLNKDCLDNKYCERDKMNNYIIFNYDFLKRLYSSHIHSIE